MRCDRCKAVWYEDWKPGDPEPETASVKIALRTPVGEGVFGEKEVEYEVLCKRCESTVTNYVGNVELDPEARKKPKAKKEEARAQGDAQRRPPEPKSSAPRPTQRAASSGGEARRRATSESPDRAS
jgi:hypothetical protein